MPRRQSKFLFACARLTRETTNRNPKTDSTLRFRPVGLFLGASLWGLYMGLSQGLLSALVADTAPADLRGTAFGIFNLLTGGALLVASVLAGILWARYGPTATFAAGAGFAAIAAIALTTDRGRRIL